MKTQFVPASPAAGTTTAAASGQPFPRQQMTQRRIHRRVPHRVPCRVRLIDTTTGNSHTLCGQTTNISPGGIAIQLGSEVPLGTWVETVVPYNAGEPLFLCGTVVHARRTLTSNFEIGVATENDIPPA